MYGFAKNERDNVGSEELADLRVLADIFLSAKDEALRRLVDQHGLQEIDSD